MGAFSGLDMTRAYGLDFLFPIKDTAIGASLKTFGEFARPLMEAIDGVLAQAGEGLFIDVGANVGSICLPVAARRPQSAVLALEANRPLATLLAANALGNRLENVTVVHAAAGPAAGLGSFPTPSLEYAANYGVLHFGLNDPTLPRENVRVCTLDEVAAPGATRVVKIDVEGFEMEVLQGAQRLLREERPAWVVEVVRQDRSKAVLNLFRETGYDLYWLWAPFTTRLGSKQANTGASVAGDCNLVAMPPGVKPPLDLPPIPPGDDSYPDTMDAYPYLKQYGF